MPRVPTAELVHREYWSPAHAASVLGRSAEYWARTFDAGLIAGYRDGKRGTRNINAASARAYLQGLSTVATEDPLALAKAKSQESLRLMRAANRAASQATAGSDR